MVVAVLFSINGPSRLLQIKDIMSVLKFMYDYQQNKLLLMMNIIIKRNKSLRTQYAKLLNPLTLILYFVR